MQKTNYGPLTPGLIGIGMKEMVRRAIAVIRDQRFRFEAKIKKGYTGMMDDVVTSADLAAQAVYVKLMKEGFPGYGIIAEEDALRIDCTNRELGDTYFTVDPLDGTKAYKRRQSHGIGTMIALVRNGSVIAAYIGDVMTKEIYGFRPESNKVHRISEYGHAEQLTAPSGGQIGSLQLLLRKRPSKYGDLTRTVIASCEDSGPFRDFEITSGSIGISMARLWKGEVDVAVVGSNRETPWDTTPVIGICEKLGYIFLVQDDAGRRFVQAPTALTTETVDGTGDKLVIHQSKLADFNAWQDAHLSA